MIRFPPTFCRVLDRALWVAMVWRGHKATIMFTFVETFFAGKSGEGPVSY